MATVLLIHVPVWTYLLLLLAIMAITLLWWTNNNNNNNKNHHDHQEKAHAFRPQSVKKERNQQQQTTTTTNERKHLRQFFIRFLAFYFFFSSSFSSLLSNQRLKDPETQPSALSFCVWQSVSVTPCVVTVLITSWAILFPLLFIGREREPTYGCALTSSSLQWKQRFCCVTHMNRTIILSLQMDMLAHFLPFLNNWRLCLVSPLTFTTHLASCSFVLGR